MLLKTQTVRRDLRELSGPTRFLISLNLKRLLDGCERGERIGIKGIRSKPECH